VNPVVKRGSNKCQFSNPINGPSPHPSPPGERGRVRGFGRQTDA